MMDGDREMPSRHGGLYGQTLYQTLRLLPVHAALTNLHRRQQTQSRLSRPEHQPHARRAHSSLPPTSFDTHTLRPAHLDRPGCLPSWTCVRFIRSKCLRFSYGFWISIRNSLLLLDIGKRAKMSVLKLFLQRPNPKVKQKPTTLTSSSTLFKDLSLIMCPH